MGPSVRPASWEFRDGFVGGLRGPDPTDPRDLKVGAYARRLGLAPVRPPEASVMQWLPPVFNQGDLGSCVSNAFVAARELLSLKVGHARQPLSRLWLYYEARRRFWPDEINQDTGLYMRDGIMIVAGSDLTALHGRGIAHEAHWPYDISKFAVNPPASSYGPAKAYANVKGYRAETLGEMLDVIAAGWPVALGFTLRTNFWQAKGSGKVPMPQGFVEGGHAVLAVHYKDDPSWIGGGYVTCRNSWGSGSTGFTTTGDLYFPYGFFLVSQTYPDAWAMALNAEVQPA